MAGNTQAKKVDLTTSIGTLSFPHLFKSQAENNKNDKGEPVYDVQFIIPKSDREGVKAILRAIQEVGKAKWGDNWKKVRTPLRDGDKEKGELTEDGTTKGEKYPERLGCYFLNARSYRAVGVVDRQRNPIVDENDVYGGCKGKIAVTFYPYSQSGNHGIGVGLNGVQKISDGESFGGGRPSMESMFDLLDDEDDLDLDESADESDESDEFDELEDEVEETPPPRKRAAAKKAAPAAKKAAPATRRKPAPEPEPEEDEADEYDDLDDLDDDL